MISPRILMCRPDCYEIEYEINPWMSCERQVDHDLAVQPPLFRIDPCSVQIKFDDVFYFNNSWADRDKLGSSMKARSQWTTTDLKLARRIQRWRTIRSFVLVIGIMGLASAVTRAAEPPDLWLFSISPLLRIVVMTLLGILLLAAMILLVLSVNGWLRRRDEKAGL